MAGFDIRGEALCEIIIDLFKAINDSCDCEEDRPFKQAMRRAAFFMETNCTKITPKLQEDIDDVLDEED